jgi:RNase P/RNase MRP subunit POP5
MVRLKRRYIVVQMRVIDPESAYSPEESDLVAGIQSPFTEMYGLFGAASVLTILRVLNWNRAKRIGVIQVPRHWCQNVQTFFRSLTAFGGIPVQFVVHHASGTIEKARRWIDENDFAFF